MPTRIVVVEVLLEATGSMVVLEVTLVIFWMTVSAAVAGLICKVTVNVAVPAFARLAIEQLMGVVPPIAGVVQLQPAGTVPMD